MTPAQKPQISVYASICNEAKWCHHLDIPEGSVYTVLNTGSFDGSGEILMAKGVEVLTQEAALSRCEQFDFLRQHFLASTSDWFKWLCPGDYLLPNAEEEIIDAAFAYPNADIIVCGVKEMPAPFSEDRLLSSLEALELSSLHSRWFHSLSSLCISRSALQNLSTFGELPLDYHLFLNLIGAYSTLCLTRPLVLIEQDRMPREDTPEGIKINDWLRDEVKRRLYKLSGDVSYKTIGAAKKKQRWRRK